ncbi:unnamed protein product [Calicophoron daubneyi]|uniref:Uncharacterized protein n=1 Tax=Calicophoron daubneyi TaxID=300641 RepID=A0AAV2TSV8_CALDB
MRDSERAFVVCMLLSALTVTGAGVKCYSCNRCKPPSKPGAQQTTDCSGSECVTEVTRFLNGTRIDYYGCPKSEHTPPAGGTHVFGLTPKGTKEAYFKYYICTTGDLSNNNLIAPIDPCPAQAEAGSLRFRTSLVTTFGFASLIIYLGLIQC